MPAIPLFLGLRNGPRSIDKPNVTERLRKIAEKLARRRIDLFREQADVIRECDRTRKNLLCARHFTHDCPGLREPERAQQECPFLSGKTVASKVAINESV